MLAQLLYQILDWIFGFLTLALLARCFMQWARAPFRNPLGEFIFAVTDWAVKPARRVIPSAFGWDLPSLVLAWLTQAILYGLLMLFSGSGDIAPATIVSVAVLAAIAVTRVALYLLVGVVLISALLSWINPYAPLAPIFNAIARPFLRPLQKMIPLLGGVDLSPVALLLILQILLTVLAAAQRSVFPFFAG